MRQRLFGTKRKKALWAVLLLVTAAVIGTAVAYFLSTAQTNTRASQNALTSTSCSNVGQPSSATLLDNKCYAYVAAFDLAGLSPGGSKQVNWVLLTTPSTPQQKFSTTGITMTPTVDAGHSSCLPSWFTLGTSTVTAPSSAVAAGTDVWAHDVLIDSFADSILLNSGGSTHVVGPIGGSSGASMITLGPNDSSHVSAAKVLSTVNMTETGTDQTSCVGATISLKFQL